MFLIPPDIAINQRLQTQILRNIIPSQKSAFCNTAHDAQKLLNCFALGFRGLLFRHTDA